MRLEEIQKRLIEASEALQALQATPTPTWESVTYPLISVPEDPTYVPCDISMMLQYLNGEIQKDIDNGYFTKKRKFSTRS